MFIIYNFLLFLSVSLDIC